MIELSGKWVQHPTKGYRDWRGTVKASYEWLAVALLRVGDTVEWVKSSATIDDPAKHEVRLLISPPEQAIGTSISYGIAGTVVRWNLRTMDPDILPSMPSRTQLSLGKVFWLGTASASFDLGFGGIIIHRDDAKKLRQGHWRLREASASRISLGLRDILTRGRVGKIPLVALAELE